MATFGVEAYVNYQEGPEMWRRYAQQWAELKADFVSVRAAALKGVGAGLDSPAEHIKALETFWREVGDLSGD